MKWVRALGNKYSYITIIGKVLGINILNSYKAK